MHNDGIIISLREEHFLNAEDPIIVKFEETARRIKDVHSLKAESSITLTESGIKIHLRDLHPQNADDSIVEIFDGITILVRDVHPLNKNELIDVIDFGRLISSMVEQSLNIDVPRVVMFVEILMILIVDILSRYVLIIVSIEFLFEEMMMCFNDSQLLNVFIWIFVSFTSICNCSNFEQFSKDFSPICFTEEGISNF